MLSRVSAKTAAAIDAYLMGPGGFSIDQLMELAGLSVACASVKMLGAPPDPRSDKGANILVLAGPGNNGGDGLVASRHLKIMGYEPVIYIPKHGKAEILSRLDTQLQSLGVERFGDSNRLAKSFEEADLVIDSLFGFSFKPPVRPDFADVMARLESCKKPVLSVDIPTGWNVDLGPCGSPFMPTALISLTAPKQCTEFFTGRHFIGGRFVGPALAEKFGFQVPPYSGTDQIYEDASHISRSRGNA